MLQQPVHDQLEPLLPLPAGYGPDWADVRRRAAGKAPHGRRRMLLGAAAVAAALVATAIAEAMGGFDAWLNGQPGSPAPPAAQQAFEAANARTWNGFAPGTELRQLLSTTESGTTFVLDGFRSGDDLCLRLSLSGSESGSATRCAPEHALQTADRPAVVVSADEPFGTLGPANAQGYTREAYQATFGIVSDGVQGVQVNGDDGTRDALVGGNAFLYVDDHPAVGARVRGVTAVSGAGEHVALAFESSPFGILDLASPPTGVFHGPPTVQRHVAGGAIAWIAAGDDRGDPVPAALATRLDPLVTHLPPGIGGRSWPSEPVEPVLERIVRPDPSDVARMIVIGLSPSSSMSDPEAGLCIDVSAGDEGGISGGCGRLSDEFAHGPLQIAMGGSGMSQYVSVDGAASDDVARIVAYLGDGDVVPVSLRDNLFFARIARADFPLRVVAYDSSGLVIDVKSFASDGLTSSAPLAARRSVKQLDRVTGPHGGVATLRAGDPADGYRCWSIDLTGGASEGGCSPWPVPDDGLKLLDIQGTRGDTFLLGQVPASIASIRIGYPDGTTQTVDTTSGYALALLKTGATAADVRLTGLDPAGKEVATAGRRLPASAP
jgi:hypothetical protein